MVSSLLASSLLISFEDSSLLSSSLVTISLDSILSIILVVTSLVASEIASLVTKRMASSDNKDIQVYIGNESNVENMKRIFNDCPNIEVYPNWYEE